MSYPSSIDSFRKAKEARGVATYRKSKDEPFAGDPWLELIEEIADGLNYLEEIARRDGLHPGTIERIEMCFRDAFVALRCDTVFEGPWG